MTFLQNILGITSYPQELKSLSLRYLGLNIVVSVIYLSHAWISLYYLTILNSFSIFGIILAVGMLCGVLLDLPLGILTDRFGQKIAFCGALFSLAMYYGGLIFAVNPIDFILLEIIVGIYSALLSGSFVSWFMNSWEFIAAKESVDEFLFRNIMGNINFAKTILISSMTFLGGFLLQQKHISPQGIFLIQALISTLGVILGVKLISSPRSEYKDNSLEENELDLIYPKKDKKRSIFERGLVFQHIMEKYVKIIPFFISFSLLAFTSVSFSSLVFAPLIYDISTPDGIFNTSNYEIEFETTSLMLVSGIIAFSNLLFAFTSRISSKVTSFIHSPYKGLLIFYILAYPVIWISYLFTVISFLPLDIKLSLIVIIFFVRVILVGLATGLYWSLYLNITSSETRSSQESLFNTINLTFSLLGYGLIGTILEATSFVGALIFLFIISILGIILLGLAKMPKYD